MLRWFTGDPVRFGLPKPDYRMYESHPVVNSLVLHHMGHGDIGVKPDVARFEGRAVHFKDGRSQEYDLVLCATGYRPNLDYLAPLGALDARGQARQRGGISQTVPGLYYVGLSGQRTLASATLRGVGADAAYVVRHLRRHLARAVPCCDQGAIVSR